MTWDLLHLLSQTLDVGRLQLPVVLEKLVCVCVLSTTSPRRVRSKSSWFVCVCHPCGAGVVLPRTEVRRVWSFDIVSKAEAASSKYALPLHHPAVCVRVSSRHKGRLDWTVSHGWFLTLWSPPPALSIPHPSQLDVCMRQKTLSQTLEIVLKAWIVSLWVMFATLDCRQMWESSRISLLLIIFSTN